jgi:hypothetical protein
MRRTTTTPSDYLQAFTHFTYGVTNQKVMVCDLQGVYDTDAVPPKFELTDPAIHYASRRREVVFGRTLHFVSQSTCSASMNLLLYTKL